MNQNIQCCDLCASKGTVTVNPNTAAGWVRIIAATASQQAAPVAPTPLGAQVSRAPVDLVFCPACAPTVTADKLPGLAAAARKGLPSGAVLAFVTAPKVSTPAAQ